MEPAWALVALTAAALLMAPDTMDYLWVGVGGFLGANARYALGVWLVGR
jgi:hypothetical protein